MTPAFPRDTGQFLHDPGLSQGHGTVSTWSRPFPGSRDTLRDPGLSQGHGTVSSWPRPFPGSRDSLYMTPAFPRVTGPSVVTMEFWMRVDWKLIGLLNTRLFGCCVSRFSSPRTHTLSFCLYHCDHSPCLSVTLGWNVIVVITALVSHFSDLWMERYGGDHSPVSFKRPLYGVLWWWSQPLSHFRDPWMEWYGGDHSPCLILSTLGWSDMMVITAPVSFYRPLDGALQWSQPLSPISVTFGWSVTVVITALVSHFSDLWLERYSGDHSPCLPFQWPLAGALQWWSQPLSPISVTFGWSVTVITALVSHFSDLWLERYSGDHSPSLTSGSYPVRLHTRTSQRAARFRHGVERQLPLLGSASHSPGRTPGDVARRRAGLATEDEDEHPQRQATHRPRTAADAADVQTAQHEHHQPHEPGHLLQEAQRDRPPARRPAQGHSAGPQGHSAGPQGHSAGPHEWIAEPAAVHRAVQVIQSAGGRGDERRVQGAAGQTGDAGCGDERARGDECSGGHRPGRGQPSTPATDGECAKRRDRRKARWRGLGPQRAEPKDCKWLGPKIVNGWTQRL